MSDGKMQELIDKIRREYSTLTNKKGDSSHYVYIVKNLEFLIDVGRSSNDKETALSGEVTDLEHPKSGIAMMASAYNHSRNNIYFIPTTKSKGAEIERELKQIEKNIKKIVISHYDISSKDSGDLYCSGMTKISDVAGLLKGFLYENLSRETLGELNEPTFSFSEILEMFGDKAEAWPNVIRNQKAAQYACKLLGAKQR